MTDDVDYDSVPVTTEERYDEETKSMRWEILINGWSIGNSSSEASAIERGAVVARPRWQSHTASTRYKRLMLSRTPEEVQQRREAQIAARREEHRKHREQQLREHRERRRQEG